jgi:hypothetical protein
LQSSLYLKGVFNVSKERKYSFSAANVGHYQDHEKEDNCNTQTTR